MPSSSPPPSRKKKLKLWAWPWSSRRTHQSLSPVSQTTSQTSSPICPQCGSRPLAFNSTSGNFFDYCSRGCAKKAKSPKPAQAGTQSDLCEQCNLRPKYNDGNKTHLYCSRTCSRIAANAAAAANTPVNPPVRQRAPTTPPVCLTPGCDQTVFTRQDGTLSSYCTDAHEELGAKGCISCRIALINGPTLLCQSCHDNVRNSAPIIVQVPENHNNYESVKSQFKRTWRHSSTSPEVKAVYKIIASESSLKQYQQYLDAVETRGNFVAMGKSRGNENRRWHGTRRKCLLGDTGNTSFCNDMGCSLCCIIKSSFDLKYCKSATGWGRFGVGIYTSSTSSKSNDYSSNLGITSTWKALLLNKVVVGNGKKLVNDNTSLTEPPAGFDSVLAEVSPGGSVNYDELIVYRNDAVRPSYLVMYQG